ncbi:phosphotransferase family protein [Streptomyces endophyticus]|uniref:Ecdysteroid 22-kinase family protein n=1 Tax=Streptomyces endophyticus TaxID=714166 RepID=A0ABU6EY87_9ACTN|nr:phosphotransferase [Streptomyces endophyticus]MEB8336150.1 ecdysteroid 22-kinase family protein [Streptomyces endophyticus]
MALSPAWLTAVLRQRYPGAVVTATEVTERIETVATKVRFDVTYKNGAVPKGAPPALCVKAYFNPATRQRGASRAEVDFYRLLAGSLPVRTPPCVHAEVDEETGHPLLLMHDLVATGTRFGDPLMGFGRDQAAGTLDQLAALHAATWDGTKPQDGRASNGGLAAAFPPRLARLTGYMAPGRLQAQLVDGRTPSIPAGVRRADRLLAAVNALAELSAAHPRCLVHGDVHTGNVYATADGSPGLIDWQVVQYGVWALDVGYHLAAVLDPDERVRSERQLLDHYLDRLAAHGGTPPGRDEAWWAYRAHLPYGFFLWGITRAVDRPITERHAGRLAQAVAWHDSFGLLGV